MVSIGIRELRQHASRYVAMARNGHRVAVTDRGTLAAYLVPVTQPAPVLDQLAAAGEYRPPTGDLLDVQPLPLPEHGPTPSEVLAAMRDEERW